MVDEGYLSYIFNTLIFCLCKQSANIRIFVGAVCQRQPSIWTVQKYRNAICIRSLFEWLILRPHIGVDVHGQISSAPRVVARAPDVSMPPTQMYVISDGWGSICFKCSLNGKCWHVEGESFRPFNFSVKQRISSMLLNIPGYPLESQQSLIAYPCVASRICI